MIECVILRVRGHYVGYVKGKEHLCSTGDTPEEVVENILTQIDVCDYVYMEVSIARLLNELNIERDEDDESTID
jgi:predicted RNase H-like HicB family nuclease